MKQPQQFIKADNRTGEEKVRAFIAKRIKEPTGEKNARRETLHGEVKAKRRKMQACGFDK
jgi:hypothetical protein